MKQKINEIFKNPLVMPILLFVLGAVLFTNPDKIIKVVTIIFGSIFILLGFIRLANYLGNKKKGIVINSDLTYAVTMMICGISIILFAQMIELAIRLIMGAWILYSGIMRMSVSLKTRENNLSLPGLIVSIIMIGIGLYIIFKSNLVFSGIGLFIMFYAILEITTYIILMNNNKKNKVIIIK